MQDIQRTSLPFYAPEYQRPFPKDILLMTHSNLLLTKKPK